MARRHFGDAWAENGPQTDPGQAKTEAGWGAEKPSFQKMNWIDGRQDEQLAHLETHGIAIWDAQTNYVDNGFALGSDGVLYQAQQANVGIDPTTDGGTNWLPFVRQAGLTHSGIIELATTQEVNIGADAFRAVSPATLAGRTAQTTRTGLVELADQAEVNALTDVLRAVTPGMLGGLSASTTQRGILALATVAEALAGVVPDKALTPELLGALASSLGPNGYQTFVGGLILQWGTVNFGSRSLGQSVPLPLTFPTNFWAAATGGEMVRHLYPGAGVDIYAHAGSAVPETTSSILVGSAIAADITWFALGN